MSPTAVFESADHLLCNNKPRNDVSVARGVSPEGVPAPVLQDVALSSGSSVLHAPLLAAGPPLNSSDGSALYLYTVTSECVHVRSTASSSLLHSLPVQQEAGKGGKESPRVLAASVDPRRPGHLIVLQSDGQLVRWHGPLGVCLQRCPLLPSLTHWREPATPVDGPADWLQSFLYVTASGQTYVIVSKPSDSHDTAAYLVRVNLPPFGSESVTPDSERYHVSMVLRRVVSRAMLEGGGPICQWLVAFSGGEGDSMVAAVAEGYRGSRRRGECPGAGCGVVVAPLRSASSALGGQGGLHVLYSGSVRRLFVSVACRGSAGAAVVAAGDSTGCIHLWHLSLPSSQPLYSTMHWHSTPVLALAFGAAQQLFSGGGESVLCVWSLEKQDERPAFLPRLGSPLLHICTVRCVDSSGAPVMTQVDGVSPLSPASHFVVVAQCDNILQLVEVLERRLLRASCSDELVIGGSAAPPLLLQDPASRVLVLGARPGHLQFFCPRARRQLFTLDITRQNFVSGDCRQREPVSCGVKHAVFTCGCEQVWMVTVEGPTDGEFGGECDTEQVLKFWRWDASSQQYSLTTIVHDPHDSSLICLSTSQQTSTPLVVTASSSDLKLWTVSGEEAGWWLSCALTHRQLPVQCVAVAPGGAAVAAAFSNSSVVVWRVTGAGDGRLQCERAAVLRAFARAGEVQQVVLTLGQGRRDLLVSRDSLGEVLIWDVEAQRVLSRVSQSATLLAAGDFLSPSLLVVFSRHVPTAAITAHVWDLRRMVQTHVTALGIAQSVLAALVTHIDAPAANSDTSLAESDAVSVVYLTDQQCLRALLARPAGTGDVPYDAEDEEEACHLPRDSQPAGRTPFAALMARRRQDGGQQESDPILEEDKEPSTAGVARTMEETLSALDAPSHTVTSLTRLCETLVSTLLPQLHQCPTYGTAGDEGEGVEEPANGGEDDEELVEVRACPKLDQLTRIDFSFLSSS